jgi:hypothetical protein
VPFLLTNIIGYAAREDDGRIYSFSRAVSMYFLSSIDLCSVSLYRGMCLSLALLTNSIS